MSRKLATTIKDSAIPGKYKRVLEAYAAFANNDGTNIRPSQQQLGNKAGTSRWTFGRNTAALIEAGILRRAQSHTCKVKECNKGTTHFTGTWGRYTLVYEIDISLLQNAERYLGAKQQKVNGAKCRKVMGANCYTTQALPLTPAPASLGITENSSALTSGSEGVREGADDSLRSSSTRSTSQTQQTQPDQTLGSVEAGVAKRSQKQNQPQPQERVIHWHCPTLSDIWLRRTGRTLTVDECHLASKLIAAEGYKVVEAVLDITLNKREKSAKMVWKRFQVFVDNWQTNYDLSMAWYTVQKAKNTHPREIPPKFNYAPMTKEEEKTAKEYFRETCKAGEWSISQAEMDATGASIEQYHATLNFCCENIRRVTKQGFLDLLVESMAVIADKPLAAAAGAGFEHEEAE
jgi:hypothetical protein